MTLQEILKAKGMTDEDITVVLADMKQNKIFTTMHENMDVRYPKLKTDHDTLTGQYEQLKAGGADNAALQGEITAYKTQIAQLQTQLNEQKIDSAMDRTLTAAGAKADDLDYLKFQWRKKGEITLDDKGEIKDAENAVAGLKTQHPVQFMSETTQRELEPHKLPDRNKDSGSTVTKEEFNKMGYNSRVKLKESDPELYNQLTKG